MKVLTIGSCRVKRFRAYLKSAQKENLYVCKHHLHSLSEICQLIELLIENKIEKLVKYGKFHNEIVARKGTLGVKNEVEYYRKLREKILDSEYIVIEISSIKRIVLRDYGKNIECNITAMSSLGDEDRNSVEERTINENEFSKFFLRLIELIPKEKIILVPHYFWNLNGGQIKSRVELKRMLLSNADKYGVKVIDPDCYISRFGSKLACKDSSHYTDFFELFQSKLYTILTRAKTPACLDVSKSISKF